MRTFDDYLSTNDSRTRRVCRQSFIIGYLSNVNSTGVVWDVLWYRSASVTLLPKFDK